MTIAILIQFLRDLIHLLGTFLLRLEQQEAVGRLDNLHLAQGPRPATPSDSSVTLRQDTPPSPSAWRQERTTNTELREEYQRAGICGHYFHEARRPRLHHCPVC